MSNRESWGPHGKLAYYVGPAMNHYRCHRVYIPSTKKVIITNTIEYTEDNLFEIPYSSKEDELLDAVIDLQNILKSEGPPTSHPLSPRQTTINKPRQTLLQAPSHASTNSASPPRVAVSKPTLPRVGTPNAEDPPELEEEELQNQNIRDEQQEQVPKEGRQLSNNKHSIFCEDPASN